MNRIVAPNIQILIFGICFSSTYHLFTLTSIAALMLFSATLYSWSSYFLSAKENQCQVSAGLRPTFFNDLFYGTNFLKIGSGGAKKK